MEAEIISLAKWKADHPPHVQLCQMYFDSWQMWSRVWLRMWFRN